MRTLLSLTLLGATLGAAQAQASCPTTAISMFTSPGLLPPKPLLVIEHQGELMGSDVTTQVVLAQGQTLVGVKVVRSLLGRLVRQFVVVPERPLEDGEWVVTPRAGSAAAEANYHHPLGTITVDHSVSIVPPRFLTQPKSGRFDETRFGCGPETLLVFDDSELDRDGLVEVTLRGTDFELTGFASGSTKATERIAVGVWMCGGAFDLPRGKTFAVTLTPVGADGTKGPLHMVLASTPPEPPPRIYRAGDLQRLFGLPSKLVKRR
jgi:hypothetical protein